MKKTKAYCIIALSLSFAACSSTHRQQITEIQDIANLLKSREIAIQAQGSGIDEVFVRITKLVSQPITVRIRAGTFFVSSDPSAQNMVTTRDTAVPLVSSHASISLAAACASRPLHIPTSYQTFTVQPASGELTKVAEALQHETTDFGTRQAAIWIVTDDANYFDLGILHDGARQIIGTLQAARAMKICDDAGIDITRKAIWWHRGLIFSSAAVTADPDLQNWYSKRLDAWHHTVITRRRIGVSLAVPDDISYDGLLEAIDRRVNNGRERNDEEGGSGPNLDFEFLPEGKRHLCILAKLSFDGDEFWRGLTPVVSKDARSIRAAIDALLNEMVRSTQK